MLIYINRFGVAPEINPKLCFRITFEATNKDEPVTNISGLIYLSGTFKGITLGISDALAGAEKIIFSARPTVNSNPNWPTFPMKDSVVFFSPNILNFFFNF